MEENKTTPPSPTAAPAPRRSGGLYAKINMSVRAANIMVASLLAVLILVSVFVVRHNGFTVSFDTDGGSAVPPVKVMYAETVSPEQPVKEGWRFTGWYTDRDCTVRWTPGDPITGSCTLYAGWEKAA